MNRFILPVCMVMAYLMLCSKSCDREEEAGRQREEERFRVEIDSITSSLERDVLPDQTLQAFVVKASEKLMDFADFLSIYSKENLDGSFRTQTGSMIRDLFVSDTVFVKIDLFRGESPGYKSLKDLLSEDFQKSRGAVAIAFDSIRLLEPLKWEFTGSYKGTLGVVQRLDATGTGTGIPHSPGRKVDFYARKVKKQIGSDSIRVWQVFLGGIH